MAGNKTKVDQIHDLLPKHLNSKTNTNWKALVDALGEQDQDTANLVSEVRKQFFVKTASRPYLDRLASNSKIVRPRLVGMDDAAFRQYIPVLSYQPKQVKLIIDQLLDIFFFKESTTSFITSTQSEPFLLHNSWELEILVDEQYIDRIVFSTSDFTSIAVATADEIVATINRQAEHCYATSYYDSITKNTFIRMFTNTIGSKGSLRLTGGRSNIAFQFNGFNLIAGNGSNTQWNITKIGDEVTFKETGGTTANIPQVKEDDIVIINIPGNQGSFEITSVNLADNSIKFINLFATAGNFTNSDANDVKFLRPLKEVAYLNDRRAMTWETTAGEITVEMPTSPPVVKRSLKGSAHINGPFSTITNRVSNTSVDLLDATEFPESGSFWLEGVNAIMRRVVTSTENTVLTDTINSRLQSAPQKYEYTGRTGNNLSGITPNLPTEVSLNEYTLSSLTRTSNVVTGTTSAPHNYLVGETAIINGSSGIQLGSTTGTTSQGSNVITALGSMTGVSPGVMISGTGIPINTFVVSSVGATVTMTEVATASNVGTSIKFAQGLNGGVITSITTSTFTYNKFGTDGTATTTGTSGVERIGLAATGSKVILTDAIDNDVSRITGTYIWDQTTSYVLSSNTATVDDAIQAGRIVRLLTVSSNTIPSDGGYLIFDYGQATQEGPVRFLYKPTDNTIAIDPSYTFRNNHAADAPIVSISHKGPHVMSGTASEYPAYITDPSEARLVLEELIRSVKSAGIFVNFLVRYPEQLYATLDVYASGVDPG